MLWKQQAVVGEAEVGDLGRCVRALDLLDAPPTRSPLAMTPGGVAVDGAGRLVSHDMSPAMCDIPVPFGDGVRDVVTRVDHGDGRAGGLNGAHPVQRHGAVGRHDDAGLAKLGQRPEYVGVLESPQAQRSDRFRWPTALAELPGEPRAQALVDHQGRRSKHSGCLGVLPHGVPPAASIGDLGVAEVEACTHLLHAVRFVGHLAHHFSRHASASDGRSATEPIGVDLDVLETRQVTRCPAASAKDPGDAVQVVGRDLPLPWLVGDVPSRLMLERDDPAVGRTSPPFDCHSGLLSAKYEFLAQGLDLEYFHASENKQAVRDIVFDAIAPDLESLSVYSIILQKNKAHQRLRDPRRFYPLAVEWLMKYALFRSLSEATRSLVVITDSIPVSRRRREAEKSLKAAISAHVPRPIVHHIFHHQSRADLNLQIVDYMHWAVFRKWESGDPRAYERIRSAVRSEGELFGAGTVEYY